MSTPKTSKTQKPPSVPDRRGTDGLTAEEVTLGYDRRTVVDRLSTAITPGEFTVIIGPNGCGKSTLLRGLGRILTPGHGTFALDGRDLAAYGPKELARRIGLLAQSSIAPDGISVVEPVSRGRFPHQKPFQQWSAADEHAVTEALHATGTYELRERPVDALSGGQRQRVWVAMALAQETATLLLDEPTTFLDVAHQIELLDLFADLHEAGRTIVAVLHDLNHAARYAQRLIVLRDGAIQADGAPADVLTAELVGSVFGMDAIVIEDPESGTPLVVPKARRRARAETGPARR